MDDGQLWYELSSETFYRIIVSTSTCPNRLQADCKGLTEKRRTTTQWVCQNVMDAQLAELEKH